MKPYRARLHRRCRECRRAGRYDKFTAPPKKPDQPCPTCKSTDIADMEKAHYNSEAKRERCYCHGVPHPHRPGTHRMCEHHPMADVPLTGDDEQHWIEVLQNTRRTSYQ